MNYENYFTKPFTKMSTLQFSACGGCFIETANLLKLSKLAKIASFDNLFYIFA